MFIAACVFQTTNAMAADPADRILQNRQEYLKKSNLKDQKNVRLRRLQSSSGDGDSANTRKYPVTTALDEKYDFNGNGWLEPGEIKLMIKTRYGKSEGLDGALVSSSVEEEYDLDKNGELNDSEIEKILDAWVPN